MSFSSKPLLLWLVLCCLGVCMAQSGTQLDPAPVTDLCRTAVSLNAQPNEEYTWSVSGNPLVSGPDVLLFPPQQDISGGSCRNPTDEAWVSDAWVTWTSPDHQGSVTLHTCKNGHQNCDTIINVWRGACPSPEESTVGTNPNPLPLVCNDDFFGSVGGQDCTSNKDAMSVLTFNFEPATTYHIQVVWSNSDCLNTAITALVTPQTDTPTMAPTSTPTDVPTDLPTSTPTDAPTDVPSVAPTSPHPCNQATGSCFAAKAPGGVGCEQFDCCAAVCESMPHCCEGGGSSWDAQCVKSALLRGQCRQAHSTCPAAKPLSLPMTGDPFDPMAKVTVTESFSLWGESGAVPDPEGTPAICGLAGSTLWYTVDVPGPAGQEVTVSTCGSCNFDTVIGAWTACPVMHLDRRALLSCSNEAPDCPGGQQGSQFTVTTTQANQKLWILVGGFFGAKGTGSLSITGPVPPPPGTVLLSPDSPDTAALATDGSMVAVSGTADAKKRGPARRLRLLSLLQLDQPGKVVHEGPTSSHVWSPNNRYLAWLSDDGEVFAFDTQGGPGAQAVRVSAGVPVPTTEKKRGIVYIPTRVFEGPLGWSGDSSRVLFGYKTSSGSGHGKYAAAPDGSNTVLLSTSISSEKRDSNSFWAPVADSQFVVLHLPGDDELWAYDSHVAESAKKANFDREFALGDYTNVDATVSVLRTKYGRLYRMTVSGTTLTLTKLSNPDVVDFVVVPSSNTILYAKRWLFVFAQLYRANLRSGSSTSQVNGPRNLLALPQLRLSPDESHLAYVDSDGSVSVINVGDASRVGRMTPTAPLVHRWTLDSQSLLTTGVYDWNEVMFSYPRDADISSIPDPTLQPYGCPGTGAFSNIFSAGVPGDQWVVWSPYRFGTCANTIVSTLWASRQDGSQRVSLAPIGRKWHAKQVQTHDYVIIVLWEARCDGGDTILAIYDLSKVPANYIAPPCPPQQLNNPSAPTPTQEDVEALETLVLQGTTLPEDWQGEKEHNFQQALAAAASA